MNKLIDFIKNCKFEPVMHGRVADPKPVFVPFDRMPSLDTIFKGDRQNCGNLKIAFQGDDTDFNQFISMLAPQIESLGLSRAQYQRLKIFILPSIQNNSLSTYLAAGDPFYRSQIFSQYS